MAATKTNWKSLEHHAGAAVEVPTWAKWLLTGSDWRRYCGEFEDAFVENGRSCSAAAPAIELLLGGLSKAGRPEWVLRAIANIAGSDQLWGWLHEPDQIAKDVGSALFEHRAEIFWALKHKTPAVRSAAAFVLAVAPSELAAEAIEHLAKRLAADASPPVLASSVLALARLSAAEAKNFSSVLTAHESPLVRGAVAVALLRSEPKLAIDPLLSGLADWLGAERVCSIPQEEFWWWSYTLRFSGVQKLLSKRLQGAIALAEMAKHQQTLDAWTDAMLALPERTEAGWSYRGATDFLAFAHGFTEVDDSESPKPTELSEAQQALAHRLMDSPLFATGEGGIPGCGAVRRRWLGLDPPSVMETLVDFKGRKEPLYWIWNKRTHGDPPVREVEDLPEPDRWRVSASDAAGEYRGWGRPPVDILEARIAAAAADPIIRELALALAREAARRIVECRRQHYNVNYTVANAALILLPLIRAKIPWDLAWEPLIALDGEPAHLARELVASMPSDRRETWLFDNKQRLRVELRYLDLLPSARLVKRSLLTIAEARRKGEKLLETTLELERKIHELSATLPHFAQALKEASAEGYKAPTGKTPTGKTPTGKTPTRKTPTRKTPTRKKSVAKASSAKAKPRGKKTRNAKPGRKR